MKYEAVFGNQDLFDGAGTFTGLGVVVHSIASGIKSYARLSDLTPESLRNHPVCAMRRIIAEPVWTMADKLAGRLPEVGCKAVQIQGFCEVDVLMIHNGCVVVCNSGISDSRPAVFEIDSFMELFTPLETPEEKAERLEDEFVNELMKDDQIIYTSSEQLAICRKTARAAYRKLKGGE